MNCYEWAAGADIKFSLDADIEHSWGEINYTYTTVTASATFDTPKNKTASQLTRKELICKTPNDLNVYIRQGTGCFNRWAFWGSHRFPHQGATIQQTTHFNDLEETMIWDGIFSFSFIVYRTITYPDGSKTYVRAPNFAATFEPWDVADPYYQHGHRRWAAQDYKISISGGCIFYPNPNENPELDPIEPPISGLFVAADKLYDFKLGVTAFDLISYSDPYYPGRQTVGSGTLNFTIEP